MVDREDFPDNSHRARENGDKPLEIAPVRQRKFDKVVTGKVVQRKKTLFKRFTENLFDGASIEDVIVSVVRDTAIPAAKDLIYDTVQMSLHRALHGNDVPIPRHRRGGRASNYDDGPYTPYGRASRPSSRRREDSRDRDGYQPRTKRDWEDVVVDSRAEAEAVLDKMHEALHRYHQVTVLDLYDMCEMNSDFTDETWGWKNLDRARIGRLRGGQYVIELPVPVELRDN
jgi:hypothetical protein